MNRISNLLCKHLSPGMNGLPWYPEAHCSHLRPTYPCGQSQVTCPSVSKKHVRPNLQQISRTLMCDKGVTNCITVMKQKTYNHIMTCHKNILQAWCTHSCLPCKQQNHISKVILLFDCQEISFLLRYSIKIDKINHQRELSRQTTKRNKFYL
jgi:hypothetical protein